LAAGTAPPPVQALRAQEAQLIEREASLSTAFGPAYPDLQRVRSSLRDLRRQIGSESSRSYAAALVLVDRSRAREQSIERSVGALTSQVNSSDAGLRLLQEKAEAIRSLLQRFEKRMEETAAEPAFITSNTTIVTHADALATAKKPIAKYLTVGAAFVGFVAGALLALLVDLRNRAFQTSIEIERQLEPQLIGMTPRAVRLEYDSPADLILYDHRSVFAEAFRLSWANIRLAIGGPEGVEYGPGRPGTVLGITAALGGEGKSTHALALARTAALAGESVVLIDADLRRAGVSRLLEQKPEATLRDFLRGRRTVNEVITAARQPFGLHIIPSVPVGTLWTIHDFRRFRELIGYLRERFATVIVDLPPVLGLAETGHLATLTDAMALIVRWDRTDRQFVHMAFDSLRRAGVATIMPVLNDVDLRAQRRRGYYDRTLAYSLYEKQHG